MWRTALRSELLAGIGSSFSVTNSVALASLDFYSIS